jgi:hypothetical protein
VTEEVITAYLVDGRIISVPLVWSWRLCEANPAQRANWRLVGDGQGVHWPDVDEDLSAEGMLHGIPAHRPGTRATSPRATPLANKALQPTSRAQGKAKPRPRAHAARG